jgi:uncharacterized protein with PQ loop repeat
MTKNETIKEFESELKKVDRNTNIKLFTYLICSVPLSHYVDRSDNDFLLSAFVIGFVAYLIYLIYSIINQKTKVAIKYNLTCPQCGKVPKVFYMSIALKNLTCPYCKTKLKA